MDGVRGWLFGTEPIAALQRLVGLGHPLPFEILSLLGDTWGIILTIGISLWLFGRERCYAVVGVVVVGAISKIVLSDLFDQQRPRGPDIVVYEPLDVGSFPSGHMYEGIAPWGLLYLFGCVPLWVPVVVGVLIGMGRLYLGAHFVGDLLGAVAVVVPFLWLYGRLWPHLWEWLRARSYGFFLGGAIGLLVGTVVWMLLVGPHPRRYEVIGMVIGGTLGLLLEYRLVRYDPPRERAPRLLAVLAGVAGVVVLLLWDRSRAVDALLFGTWAAALAMLWVLVAAPALARVAIPHRRRAAPPHR